MDGRGFDSLTGTGGGCCSGPIVKYSTQYNLSLKYCVIFYPVVYNKLITTLIQHTDFLIVLLHVDSIVSTLLHSTVLSGPS